MLTELILILILAGLLWLLLRHWPETKTEVLRQQLNTRKPQEEQLAPARLGSSGSASRPAGSWWSRLLSAVTSWLKVLLSLFSDKDGIPSATRVPPPPAPPTAAAAEPSEVEVLISRAEAAQRRGDLFGAERLLVKAASFEPKNPKIYSRLGIVYLERGDNWSEAEECFRQSLKFDPSNGFTRNNLGLVLYHQDKFAAAAKEYEAAIAVDDAVASRHVNLGLAYMALRQFGRAENAFKKAARLAPSNRDYQLLAVEAAKKRKSHARA